MLDSAPSLEKAALRLAEQGVAVVLLRERSKRPELNNWTSLPRMSAADLRRRYRPGQNIGIRLGEPSEVRRRRYLYAVDLDVRDPDSPRRASREAWEALCAIFPNARDWPRSISGSGGESRHAFFVSDGLFRKTNIARSPDRVTVKGVDKPAWEVDLYGAGAQVVVAPSIHPDTGAPYRWEDGEPDFDNLPFVRATKIAPLFERRSARRARSDYAPEPLDNLQEILETQTLDNDGGGLHYDDWRDVLFAVKQEYDGTDDYDRAFEIVQEWSQKSDKHDQQRFEEVWDHARTDRADAITLGTLKKRAAPEIDARRKDRIVAEMEDERPPRKPGDAETPSGVSDDWTREAVLDGVGEPINCAENRRLFLLHMPPAQHLVWAEEEQQPVWRYINGEIHPGLRDIQFSGAQYTPFDQKSHYQVLQMLMRKKPFYLETVRKEELNDSVYLVAPQRPWARIKDLVSRGEWDGKPRIDFLLQDYLGVEDNAYTREVSRLLVLGPTCRTLWRQVKVDYAPILQGSQGTGKDRFLEILCTFDDECLYTATSFDLAKPAEYVQIIRGKLIVHMAEMAALRKHEIEQVKTFLTEHEDTARLSYEARARTYPRLCICVFSTNETHGYLGDRTGNRRFLPVEIGDPKPGPDGRPTAYAKDFQELSRDQSQIWAEAHVRALEEAERQGGRVRELLLSEGALKIARLLQADKRAELPEADMAARGARLLDEAVPLDDLIEARQRNEGTGRRMAVRNQVCSREFWIDVLDEKKDQWSRNSRIVFHALDLIEGWERMPGQQRHKGEIQNVFRRKGTDGKPTVIDDIQPEKQNVVRMDDERRRNRRRQ